MICHSHQQLENRQESCIWQSQSMKTSYPLSAIELLARGHVDKIIQDLFGDNFDGI